MPFFSKWVDICDKKKYSLFIYLTFISSPQALAVQQSTSRAANTAATIARLSLPTSLALVTMLAMTLFI